MMADILAENLSGKSIATEAGTELGTLYNITESQGESPRLQSWDESDRRRHNCLR